LIDVEVEDPAWTTALPEAEALAVAAAKATLRMNAPSTPSGSPSPKGGEGRRGFVSPLPLREGDPEGVEGVQPRSLVILLADDAAIHDLNARFRGQDKPTNVLSFPAPENPEGHLGDIALAYGVCAREAAEQGKRLAHHLQHLVAHGVLHLLGYDHMNDDEAREMEGLESIVLAGLGVADPYAAGERDHD
jgi:probable rRNA maturation factor